MSITGAESILVIIVSAALTVFLIVAIVSLVMITKLVNSVRTLAKKAEGLVDSAESAADVLKNVGGPLAVFKLVRNIITMINQARK